MAEWSKNKVEPSAINGGKEFTKGDNLAVNELNAIVNNSFFASEKAEIAEQKVNSFVEEKGKTAVTIKDESQYKWSADFVEKEKSKSLNLWSYGDVQGENEKTTIILDTPTSEGLYYMSFGYKYNSPDYSAQLTIEFYDEDGNKNMLTGITRFHEKDSWWESVIFSRPITKIKIGVTAPNNTDKIYEGSYKLYNITLATELLLICEKPSGAITHNEDAPVVFAESERQKSKNLLVYPYADTTKTTNGITFTDNGDGSITINGTNNGGGNANFFFTSYKYKFKKGTYTLGNFASENNACAVVAYDGKYYHQAKANSSVTFTISEDISDDIETYIYMGVVKNDTFTFNNVVVKPMFVSGTELGDYQPYNGAIVHEKQLKEAVEKRELWYDATYNRISITSSTLNTLQQYFDLFKSDTNKIYTCNIGALETSKFKDLLPSVGFGNYCSCYIKHYSNGMWGNGRLEAFEIVAFEQFGQDFAKGYLYKNLNDTVVFTGWAKIGG